MVDGVSKTVIAGVVPRRLTGLEGTAAHLAFIIVLAVVCHWLVRRAIDRLVRRLEGTDAREALAQAKAGATVVDAVPSKLRAAQRAETIGALLRSVSTFVIWLIAVLSALTELDVKVAPVLAGASVLGAALGFGAQNLVRDFLAGFFVVLEDQYGVGDIIDAGTATGRVESVSLRKTRLRDLHGTVWHIPNGQMTGVGNLSQEWSQAVLDVEVDESADLERARQVVEEVACDLRNDPHFGPRILTQPEVWGLERVGDQVAALRLVVRTRPMTRFRVARELRGRIKESLDREGIPLKGLP